MVQIGLWLSISLLQTSLALFRNTNKDNPLLKPFSDAFSSKLSEIALVKQPSDVLVVDNTIFVSSFLTDTVLRSDLPLSRSTQFRVFAYGSYCTPQLQRCAVLNGPWGLAHSMGRIFVSSFGSDQVLVFEASSGRFLDALGDSGSLDSPEGLALSYDQTTLFVASFLDSRVVAFDLCEIWESCGGKEGSDGVTDTWREAGTFGPVATGRTVVSGHPVDLEYLTSENDVGVVSGFAPLHGPEGIAVLPPGFGSSRERLAVTSYYNNSIVIIDSVDGTLLEIVTGPPGSLDGPMGIVVDDCKDFLAVGDCLLVASYKTIQRRSSSQGKAATGDGTVSRFVDDGTTGWKFDGIAMSSSLLRGPSGIAMLPDGSALVCAYDGSALLLFNSTQAEFERQLVSSFAGSLSKSPKNSPSIRS